MGDDGLAIFEANRRRLFGLAYRMLGEATEAEDVLQDAYLRWAGSDGVVVPEAWLTRVVTNLCLNRLTSARARRESYVGPWLPEPVFTGGDGLGALETVEQRESVSLGMLLLLERLTPPERAVFVLREAFGYGHAEIAGILDVTEERSRQLFHRARSHIGEERRRFDTDDGQRRRIVERFLAATTSGDLEGLHKLLAEDVVAWADGGGTTAARRPVVGHEKVLRYLVGLHRRTDGLAVEATIAEVNGAPAMVFRLDGVLAAVIALDSVDGRVVAVRTIVNPAKLAFAAAQ